MNNESAFSHLHPLTLMLWFSFILCATVLTTNPAIALLSLFAASLHRALTVGVKPRQVALMAVFMLAVTLLNPLFSHHGVTVLFFLGGLPITREALLFGAFMSVLCAAAVLWCSSLSLCMTSDKVIYLFGRPFPKLAVLLSLTLRLIPLFLSEYKRMMEVRKACGLYDSSSLFGRARSSLTVFSALVTMILEDSVDTADSMRSRGVELKGRTAYSEYRFRRGDLLTAAVTAAALVFVVRSGAGGYLGFSFYPSVTELPLNSAAVASYIFFGAAALVPSITEVSLWRRLNLTACASDIPTAKNTL